MQDEVKEKIMKVIENKVTENTCYKSESYDGSSTQWAFWAGVRYSEEQPEILIGEVELKKKLDNPYHGSEANYPCIVCSNKKVAIKIKGINPDFYTAYCRTCKIVYEEEYEEHWN